MFNKKRMFIFIVFLLFLFFMMTFGSTPGGVVRINTREVKFVDGYTRQVISTQTVEVGKDAIVPDAPVHDKCKFSGWYTEDDVRVEDFTNILHDLTVYSGCAVNNYTVKFYDTISKKVIDTQTIKSGADAEAPDAPTHSGYTFVEWDKDYTNVTHNMTVNTVYKSNSTATKNAKYKVEYYTVKDGKTSLHSTKTLSGKIGSNVSAPVIKISGYKFDDGNKSNKLIGTITSNGKLVLKVYYIANTHVVIIDPQCEDVGNKICTQPGEEPGEEIHNDGDKITLKALKRSYTLSYDVKGNPNTIESKTVSSVVAGYCKNAKTCEDMISTGTEVVVDEDVTYYAIWSGNLDVTVSECTDYSSATTVYTFNTWKDGSASVAPSTVLTLSSNKELVADYSEKTREYLLTIKYVYANGDSAADTYTHVYPNGDTYEVDSPQANKAGYVPERETVKGTMPADDYTIIVKYYPSDKTKYVVRYYLKDIDEDKYTEDEDALETRTGITDAPVSITVDDELRNKYPKFTLNVSKSHLNDTIAGDGSTELTVYYDREKYIVIVDPQCEDEGSEFCTDPGDEPPEVPHEYGKKITLDTLTRSYTLSYDVNGNPTTIPSETVTSTASKYCVNNPNCTYPITVTDYVIEGDVTFYAYWEGSLTINEVANGSNYQDDETVYTFRTWLDKGTEVAPGSSLTLDNNKEIKADYTESVRKYKLTIKYVYSDGTTADTTKELDVAHGTTYNVASKDITGYTADKPIVTDTMPKKDVEVTVTYTANELEFSCDDIEKVFSTTDQTVTLSAASNGTGNYTYSVNHTTNNFSINNDRVFTIKGNTPADTYNVDVKVDDTVSHVTKTATCKVTITKKIDGVSEGSCITGLTYTGSAQTLVENGSFVTYTNESQTNADTYTVTATANDNYAFSDGSTTKELTCTIAPKEVSVTWGTETRFTYDSEEHAPTAIVTTGIDNETMTVTRTTESEVGQYTSTASCSSVTGGQAICGNYTLTNTTKDYEIVAQEVTTPTDALCKSNATYNGREHVLATSEDEDVYTLSGATQTNAGDYTITATLSDKANYTWSDGSTTDKTFVCTIERAQVTFPTCESKTYNGSTQTLFDAHTSGEYTNEAISGIDAGTYKANLTPTDNYKWSSGDNATAARELSCTINPKEVSVNWGSTTTFTYNGEKQAPTANAETGITGETMIINRTSEKEVGEYKSTASCTMVIGGQKKCSNYTLTNTTKDYKIVAQGTVIPTNEMCASATDATYNGSRIELATAPDNAPYTLSGNVQIDAGAYTITATLKDTENYKWNDNSTSPKTFICSIAPKEVSVTWGTETTFTYDSEEHAPTATVTTGIDNETMTVTRTTESEVGQYTSTASCSSVTGGQAICGNYTLTNTTKDYEIVAQKVTTPTDTLCAPNVAYDGRQHVLATAESNTYTLSGATQTDAGDYTVTATLNDKANYTWSDGSTADKTFTCSISRVALTITAGTKSKTYDGVALTDSTCTATGLVGSQKVSCTMTSASTITNVGSVDNEIGSYTITDGETTINNNNYTVTTVKGTLTVNPITTDVSEGACNTNLVYTGSLITLAGGGSHVTYDATENSKIDAGTYIVTVTAEPNYAFSNGETSKRLSCTIERASVSFPTCESKAYNGSDQELFAAHTSGEYTNDAVSGTYVDSYTTTLTPTANYQWNSGENTTEGRTLTCSITPKAITITAKPQTITYGDVISNTINDVTVATLATGDTLSSITLTASTTDATTNGTITPSAAIIMKGTEEVTSNYTITYAPGTLSINTKKVEVPTCSDINYDGRKHTLFAAHTTGGYTNPVLEGTYADSYRVTLTLDSNYHWSDDSTENKTLTCKINKKAITITANNQSTTYGVSISKTVDDVTVETLATTDTLSAITLTESTIDATTNGTITPSNAVIMNGTTDATNSYEITYVNGNLTINTQEVTAPTCADLPYNGGVQTLFAAHTTGGYTNPVLTGTYVDTYTVTLTLSNNYHWSDGATGNKTLTCHITPKAITITAKPQTITYGETITNTIEYVTVSALGEGDELTAITLTPSTTDAITNGTITPSAAVIKKGTEPVTSNYTITYAPGVLTINKTSENVSEGNCKAGLTYTGSAQTIVENGSHVTYTNASQTSAGTYTVTATADRNYIFSDGSTTKELSCTIARQSVEVPTCASQTYSGSELTLFAAHESGAYTNSALVQTEVGSYDVELAVTDNYKWSDNTTTNKTVSCIINPIIIFNANTGSGTMSNQTATYNTATTLNENTFTKTGHDFAGWNTQADGNGTSYNDKASVTLTNNLTLYAQWTPKKYTVIWNKVTGSTTTPLETDENVPYGSAPEYNGSTPTYSVQREDGNYTYTYTFIGWKDQDGNYLTNSTVITKDTTYTAQLVVLKAKYKDNMQNAFTRGESNDSVKDRIDVYVVDSTGTTVKTLNKNEYTTNFNAATLKKSENLIINYNYSGNGQTYALTNNELYYSVVLHAHPTKFEVEMSVGNSYVESSSGCTGDPTSNSWCNVSGTNGATTTTLDHNFLKVTEHYMQWITVKQIRVTYANGKTVLLRLSSRKNHSYYDYTWSAYEDPQYIAELVGYDLIDVYLKKSHTINSNETFPDDAYTTQGNPISGTCKRGVSGYDSWTGKCTYYTFEPNTVKYDYNDRNNYYKLREDGTGYVNANVSSDEIDVEGIDREILYVSITYERNANPDEGEDAGNYRVDYEYVDGEFICTNEVKVNSTNMSADFDSNNQRKLYSAIGMSSRSRKMMMVKPLEEILEEEIPEEITEEITEDALIDDNETKEEVTPIEPEEVVKPEEVTETKEEIVKDETPDEEVKENTEESKEEEKASSLEESVETTTPDVEEEKTETPVIEGLPKEVTPVGEIVEEKSTTEIVKEDTEEKKDSKQEEKIIKEEEKIVKKEEKEEEKETKQEVKKEEKTQKAIEETIPAKKEEEEVSEE